MSLLATIRPAIKRIGDEHVRLSNDDGLDLEKFFVCPPLSTSKRVSEESGETDEQTETKHVALADLLDATENVLLLGPPESGKTTLIHYAALKTATGLTATPRLPLRAKFYDFQKGRSAIWRAVRAYANEISDGKIAAKVIETTPILLFVDDVIAGDDLHLAYLLSLVKEAPNIRWVFCADGNTRLTNVSAENERRMEDFTTVSIGDLPRASIRKLSAQWCAIGGFNWRMQMRH
ncbi:MAG: hypothetical protein AAAB35_00460 [Phyllobacterium sp.]|uniref:hypothetical protein n=1 Tax=Phyllobacterium sp. TaxID=1871046 RepID=UPI0030F036EE